MEKPAAAWIALSQLSLGNAFPFQQKRWCLESTKIFAMLPNIADNWNSKCSSAGIHIVISRVNALVLNVLFLQLNPETRSRTWYFRIGEGIYLLRDKKHGTKKTLKNKSKPILQQHLGSAMKGYSS